MKVWLVKLEEPMPVDAEYRPFRMGMLADALVKRGHHVTRWCSDLNHRTGLNRYGTNFSLDYSSSQRFEFLHSRLKYKSAVSIFRFLNNELLAHEFKSQAKQKERPDIIVCSMPTPSMAKAAADIAAFFDVPLVLDARDFWPDVIGAELKGVKKYLVKPLLWFMARQLKSAATKAVSLVGITPFFRDHLLNYANRTVTDVDSVFPLGFDPATNQLSNTEKEEARNFWEKFSVQKGESQDAKIIYFAGTLNHTVYNAIAPVFEAAAKLELMGENYKFVICGNGQYIEKITELGKKYQNVILPGRVSSKNLAYLRSISFVALQPIERRADYQNSLSNKFFEYLSSGLPILTYLDGYPGEVVTSNNCGAVYDSSTDLIECLQLLSANFDLKETMSRNALKLFNESYSSDLVYSRFVKHIECVAQQKERM
jgi:glycosyltransferase involved in cell wall biosynthesis